MARINSNWYTKGKFDRKNWRNTLDTENEFYIPKEDILLKLKKRIYQKIILRFEVEQYGI